MSSSTVDNNDGNVENQNVQLIGYYNLQGRDSLQVTCKGNWLYVGRARLCDRLKQHTNIEFIRMHEGRFESGNSMNTS